MKNHATTLNPIWVLQSRNLDASLDRAAEARTFLSYMAVVINTMLLVQDKSG